MRLKKEPKKPVRKTFNKKKSIGDFMNIQELLNWLSETFPGQENLGTIPIKEHWWYDEHEIYIEFKELESEELFNKRLTNYNEKRAEYDLWYEGNKEAIDAEIAKRERAKEIKEKKAAIKAQAQRELKEQIRQLNKELREIEKS